MLLQVEDLVRSLPISTRPIEMPFSTISGFQQHYKCHPSTIISLLLEDPHHPDLAKFSAEDIDFVVEDQTQSSQTPYYDNLLSAHLRHRLGTPCSD